MSQENMEIVRRLYPGPVDLVATFVDPEGLGALRAAIEPLVHRDFETVADPRYQALLGDLSAGSSQWTVGIDGFVSRFRDWLGAWDSWVVTPTDFVEVDENRVLVVIEITARSKTHGAEMAIQGGNVLTLRDGRLARLELFFRRAEALEAAGLRE